MHDDDFYLDDQDIEELDILATTNQPLVTQMSSDHSHSIMMMDQDEFLEELDFSQVDSSRAVQIYSQQNTSLAVYSAGPEQEKTYYLSRVFTVEKKLNRATNTKTQEDKVREELLEYIRGDSCPSIPKFHIFVSKAYNTKENFPNLITKHFMSQIKVNRQMEILEDNTPEIVESVLEILYDAFKEERIELTLEKRRQLRSDMSGFGTYFYTKMSEAILKDKAAKSTDDYGFDFLAEKVYRDGYLCPCGSIAKPQKYRTLVASLNVRNHDWDLIIPNYPHVCTGCQGSVALPEDVVLKLETIYRQILKEEQFSLYNHLFIRPPLDKIHARLDPELKGIFLFDEDLYLEPEESSEHNTMPSSSLVEMHRNLVDYWMAEKHNRVSYFSWDTESDYEKWIKTVVRYLDQVGLFTLTTRKQAQQRYLKQAGINQPTFTPEETLAFLEANKVGIASILEKESVGEPDFTILPEYMGIIKEIFELRCFGKIKFTKRNEERGYHTYWNFGRGDIPITKKSGDFLDWSNGNKRTVGKTDYGIRAISGRKTLNISAFWDYYELSKTLAASPHHIQTRTRNREEFYGLDQPDDPQLIIKPVHRFEDLKHFMMTLGYELWFTKICDHTIQDNIRIYLYQLEKGPEEYELQKMMFNPVTLNYEQYQVTNNMEYADLEKEFVKAVVIQQETSGSLEKMKQTLSDKDFHNWLFGEGISVLLEEESELLNKFPEVEKCISSLLQKD